MPDQPAKEWALVRSNGETLEVRKVSEVLMAFRSPRENRNPLPIKDEIMSLEDARILCGELLQDERNIRTK